jgi:hypothetical protein
MISDTSEVPTGYLGINKMNKIPRISEAGSTLTSLQSGLRFKSWP